MVFMLRPKGVAKSPSKQALVLCVFVFLEVLPKDMISSRPKVRELNPMIVVRCQTECIMIGYGLISNYTG